MRRMDASHQWLLPLAVLAGLVLGGAHLSHAADAGAIFARGPDMKVARHMVTITTLPGSKVAVFGGSTYGSALPTNSEIWDPATNLFTLSETGYVYYYPGFAKLHSGNYLLAGGMYTTKTAEIFAAANSFTPTGEMNYGRNFCGAATLSSGKVLVVGAYSNVTAATYGEVFDPSLGSFTATNALKSPRSQPLVLPCNDGSAVVMGGHNPLDYKESESVELYDPVNNSFSVLQDHLFPTPGWFIVGFIQGTGVKFLNSFESQRLADGRYLLLAEDASGSAITLFTFDPATKAIAGFPVTPVLPSNGGKVYYPLVDAARGKAYLLQTNDYSGSFKNVRLYTINLTTGQRNDPAGTFPLSTGTSSFGITMLADGRLFLAGGVERDPAINDWVSVKKTWFINPTRSPAAGVNLLLLD